MTDTKKLVVYFSKTGEQYGVGVISKGNTAILAEMVAKETGADLFEIKLKNDTYPTTYEPLTEVALQEKKANARPEIIGDAAHFEDYDVIFIGSPNWWSDLPMAFYTFIEKHDFSDKTVAPFITHEGSGLSSIPAKIKKATNAKAVADGLAVYGHVAQNERDKAQAQVKKWLEKIGF